MKSSSEARRFLAGSFALSSHDRRLFIRKSFPYSLCCIVCFCLVSASTWTQNAPAQTSTQAPTPAAQTESQQTSAELTSRDEPTTFKVNVKLVVVRAVVRDPQGNTIGNLHQEDFQVFDKGKPQIISQFEIEQPGAITAKARQTSEEGSTDAVTGEQAPSTGPLTVVPERFVAYVFDDVHLQFGDLAQVRNAARRHFATLRPTDRAAIFTTSGQGNLDFTDDRAKLHDALLRLQPHPITSGTGSSNDCPTMSFYEADLIQNKRDPFATSVAVQEATACLPKDKTGRPIVNPAQVVDSMSTQELEAGDHESHISLGILKAVVGDVSRMPGQRSVVLVSPGFIVPEMESEYNALIDHALRSQVVVNTLDARGLYVGTPFGDISNPNTLPPSIAGPKALIETAAESAQADLLAVLAEGTGGVFFHNNNDFDEGFRRVAQTPEYSYVLAFTPQDLKLDGSYHALKVTLKNPQKLTLQARRGYFAPKHLADPNEQAKQEIEDAMYSQEELHNLPVKLHTQFFKASEEDAKLVVLAHVDVQHLHFRKAEGRNNNVLTCVSAVFNRNGNFLQGTAKTVTMHWKDETLEHKLSSGITLKTSFDVKPGSYLVRLVVRDSEGQLMSAENGSVEIR
jgi:VWFA-related protein